MKEIRRTLSLYCLTIISLACICLMMFFMNIIMTQTANTEKILFDKFDVYCIEEIERGLIYYDEF